MTCLDECRRMSSTTAPIISEHISYLIPFKNVGILEGCVRARCMAAGGGLRHYYQGRWQQRKREDETEGKGDEPLGQKAGACTSMTRVRLLTGQVSLCP